MERRERLEPGDEVGRGRRGFTELVVDVDRVRGVSAAGAEAGGPRGRRRRVSKSDFFWITFCY